MNAKHTPGPWTVGKIRPSGMTRSMLINPVGVLTSFTRSDAELEANTRLIAAAPELLAACTRAVVAAENPEDFIEGNAAYEALGAAIAKATGEQP